MGVSFLNTHSDLQVWLCWSSFRCYHAGLPRRSSGAHSWWVWPLTSPSLYHLFNEQSRTLSQSCYLRNDFIFAIVSIIDKILIYGFSNILRVQGMIVFNIQFFSPLCFIIGKEFVCMLLCLSKSWSTNKPNQRTSLVKITKIIQFHSSYIRTYFILTRTAELLHQLSLFIYLLFMCKFYQHSLTLTCWWIRKWRR